jgi:putative heme transporter
VSDEVTSTPHSTPQAPGRGELHVPRWVQLATLPVLLLVVWFVLGAISQVVFIFLVAGLLALILNPLVHGLERVHVPRYLGVFLVYVGFVAAVVLIAVILWPPLVRQLRTLATALPGMADEASSTIARLQRLADRANITLNVRAEITRALNALASRIPQFTSNVVTIGITVVRAVTVLIVIVVISIYMLLHGPRMGRWVVTHFPTRSQADGEEFVRRAKGAVVDYIKAQLLLSATLGLSVGVAMWVLSMLGAFPNGARYALFFGVWAGLMEAIPYLGPVLAAVPPTLVAVFASPLAAVWVIITFVLIQEVEGHILVPLIMGGRFRVHPLVVIFAILAGIEVHGIAGALVAIPLIPLIKETWVFLRPRVHLEAWPAHGRGVVDSALLPDAPAGPGEDAAPES